MLSTYKNNNAMKLAIATSVFQLFLTSAMGSRVSSIVVDDGPDSKWSEQHDNDPADNNMALLGTIIYFAGMFVIGMFVWCCHRRFSKNRRDYANQHPQSQPSPPPAPKKNGMTAEEKAARKVFVEENLPAKEWVEPSGDDLEAGCRHHHATNNNHGNDKSETFHEVSLNDDDDDETTCTNDSVNDDEDCPICLIPFQKGDVVSCSTDPSSGCLHIFHRQCVSAWLLDHHECPMCRQNFLQAHEEGDEEKTNTQTMVSTSTTTTEQAIPDGGVTVGDDEEQGVVDVEDSVAE